MHGEMKVLSVFTGKGEYWVDCLSDCRCPISLEPLAKLSFSPSFSLGLWRRLVRRNRFNGLPGVYDPDSI